MKVEIIDLDLELIKMNAFDEKKAKNNKNPNFERLREKSYNLDFLSQYMDLNEEFFEEINDILVDIENKEWYRYTDALEQIKEILVSRIPFLDAMLHNLNERDDSDLCL